MTKEEIIDYFKNTDSDIPDNIDNAYCGLQIIAKYTNNVIQGAGQDIIYSEDIDYLIEKGITDDEIRELCRLNWGITGDHFTCYV